AERLEPPNRDARSGRGSTKIVWNDFRTFEQRSIACCSNGATRRGHGWASDISSSCPAAERSEPANREARTSPIGHPFRRVAGCPVIAPRGTNTTAPLARAHNSDPRVCLNNRFRRSNALYRLINFDRPLRQLRGQN